MMRRFDASSPDFDTEFRHFLASRKDDTGAGVSDAVRDIIARVRAEGDAALIAYSEQFDRLSLTPDTLRFHEAEIMAIAATCPPDVIAALTLAAERIRSYHMRQLPKGWEYEDEHGNRLGMRWSAVDAAGIYVPGGKASYPSSVLMNAIPARVAGVTRIAMVVPTPDGEVNPALLAAAQLAGITEIYRIGGAQAIAALAYGTESIAPVQVIAGPGNAYVAEAKRQVFGTVGIDMIAGPSEIAVIADGSVPAEWIAADLLSQAEHDELAQSILLTTSAHYADAVLAAIETHLAALPRQAIMRASLDRFGAVVLCDTLEQAAKVSNVIAPEHLELTVAEPDMLAARITHAGAIFFGSHTPEAIGDYVAGPSHVLPTTQTAAFASGLSVYQFMKKTSLIGCSPEGFTALADATAALAECEGLGAHALSITIRS